MHACHLSLLHHTGHEEGQVHEEASPPVNGDAVRDFKVKGKLQEDEDKLSLRLRILQDESKQPFPSLCAPTVYTPAEVCSWLAQSLVSSVLL